MAIGHSKSFKHCVAADLRYSYWRTKLGFDVIFTSFLNSPEIHLISKILVKMFLVSKEHWSLL